MYLLCQNEIGEINMNKQIISILTIFLMISCLGCLEEKNDYPWFTEQYAENPWLSLPESAYINLEYLSCEELEDEYYYARYCVSECKGYSEAFKTDFDICAKGPEARIEAIKSFCPECKEEWDLIYGPNCTQELET